MPKRLSGDMIEHHRHSHPLLLLSGPWNLRIAHKAKKAIEDEDADFVFIFISCKNWNCSKFYRICCGVAKNRV
jgi:hypothetical protein